MEVFLEKKNENLSFDFEGSVLELLSKLTINPDEVLVLKNGICVTFDVLINNKDTIKILSVVSGG